MDDVDVREIVGRRLTGVAYYLVVAGAPVMWDGHRLLLLDYGLDLQLEGVTIGFGWHQMARFAFLRPVRRSVGIDLAEYQSFVPASSDEPWASFMGAPIVGATTFGGCGSRNEVRGVELMFPSGPIHIAAATPLGDSPREFVFCSDDIMVGFGRSNLLGEALLSRET